MVIDGGWGCARPSASCSTSFSQASSASAWRRRWWSARWRSRQVWKPTIVAARVMGDWTPSAEWFQVVVTAVRGGRSVAALSRSFWRRRSRATPDVLGDRADWLVEWKWDGIRAQTHSSPR
jgi:hypothetical protein